MIGRLRGPPGVEVRTTVLWAVGFGLLFALLAGFLTVPIAAAAVAMAVIVVACLRSVLVAGGLLVAAMLFSPELRLGGGVILRAEDLLIPLLGLAVAARVVIPRFGIALRHSPLDLPVLAVLVIHALSSVRGVMAGSVEATPSLLWNGKILELFLIYWVTFNFVRDPVRVRQMLGAVLLVFLAVAAYACLQIPGTEVHSLQRLTAPFEATPEPTTLGGYLTLISAVLIAMALYEPAKARRAAYWSMTAVVILPVLFTFSRTTYLSFAVMILLLGLVTGHRMLTVVAAAAILLSPVLMPQSVIDRVEMTFDASREYGLDPSLVERISVWRKVSNSLAASPLLGQGVPQGILDSQFARILIESGVLGAAAWVWALVACLGIGWRLRRNAEDPLHKALAAGYLVGTVALLVHSIATITFYIVRIMEPFWFLTGLVASLDAYYRLKGAARDRGGPPRPAVEGHARGAPR
jgi:hypothetical protein